MDELIKNIKEDAKLIINEKEYIVKTKTFYGIKEKNELELLNINHYDDYLKLLDSL